MDRVRLVPRRTATHIARIPYDPAAWRPAPPVRAEAAEPGPDPARYTAAADGPARPYSPWKTLPPTAWAPTFTEGTELGTGIGVGIAGSDVIDRHDVRRGGHRLHGTPDAWTGCWRTSTRGWGGPVIGAIAVPGLGRGHRRAATGCGADDTPIESALLERERSASLVATWTRPRIRSYYWLSTGLNLRNRSFELADPELAPDVGVPELVPDVGAVLTVGRSTVRAFDFSVTPEEGWLTAVTVEGRRYTRALPGDDGGEPLGYVRVAGRTQAYRPLPWGGFARHVIAARLLAAADVGSRSPGFAVGGLYGGGIASPLGAGLGIGGELDFPVRGYGEGSQLGDRAVAGSLEYPLSHRAGGAWDTGCSPCSWTGCGGRRSRMAARRGAWTTARACWPPSRDRAAGVLRGRGAGGGPDAVLPRRIGPDGRRGAAAERAGDRRRAVPAGPGVLRAARAELLTAGYRGRGATNCG